MTPTLHVWSGLLLASALVACAPPPPPRAASAAAHVETADELERAAGEVHQRAQAAGDRAAYERAIALYERFLAEHRDAPRAFEVTFYDAEARYAIEDWAGAAERYRRAIALRPDDRRSIEAAYANVLATRRALGLRDGDRDPTCDERDEKDVTRARPAALPERAPPILAAYDLYLATPGDSPARPQIAYRKARILHGCARFAEAEPVLAEVVDRWASDEVAGASAALLLDCLAQQHKTAALFQRSSSLEQGPLAHDPLLEDTLRAVRGVRSRKR